MQLGLRTGAWSGEKLPYDAEVEYIQSTGTQFIITDYYARGTDILNADFQYTSSSIQQRIFANLTQDTSVNVMDVDVYINANSIFSFSLGGRRFIASSRSSDLLRHTFTLNPSEKEFLIDGTILGVSPSVDVGAISGNPTWLMNMNWQVPYIHYAHGKMYAFYVIRDSARVVDMIPVRVGSVGYMYDRVSKTLFGNAGTGAFIVGPDKT